MVRAGPGQHSELTSVLVRHVVSGIHLLALMGHVSGKQGPGVGCGCPSSGHTFYIEAHCTSPCFQRPDTPVVLSSDAKLFGVVSNQPAFGPSHLLVRVVAF